MNALSSRHQLEAGNGGGSAWNPRVAATVCDRLAVELDAVRLIELGARASLVSQLTGLAQTAATHLYRQLNGHASPSGQLPYTDAWYVKNTPRMLHASLVWRLQRHFTH